jgi:LmbE family N-acetylglucosaminyl deacetylase
LGLPDGELLEHILYIQHAIGLLVARHHISRILTTGEDGYDGHRDHIAMHIAAAGAAKAAGIEIWALNSRHRGEQKVSGDRDRKLGAMACHSTQKADPDLVHWGGTDAYTPLIVGPETYDIVPGKATGMTRTQVLARAAW